MDSINEILQTKDDDEQKSHYGFMNVKEDLTLLWMGGADSAPSKHFMLWGPQY